MGMIRIGQGFHEWMATGPWARSKQSAEPWWGSGEERFTFLVIKSLEMSSC